MVNMRTEIGRLWKHSAILTFTSALMLATFAAALIGLAVDPRIITGMPAWLKPAKFGISTAIYCATIAWLLGYIHVWPRIVRASAWTISLVLILEIAIIDLQAFRGTTSHFNHATPLDSALFETMGIAIGILWLASLLIAIALFRQHFENPAWGWALRLGMLLNVIGSASGGLMVAPTADQLDALRHKEPTPIIGAHTVGALDGGPGLPGVGWSTQHGDLRIPHFLGLHAIQAIPLFAWLFARRRSSAVFIAAASYLALYGILVWQALRGESIVAPDAATLAALAIWLAATALALFAAVRPAQHPAAEAAQ